MKAAWEGRKRIDITSKTLEWRIAPVQLPLADHVDMDKAIAVLSDPKGEPVARFNASGQIAILRRAKNGSYPVDLTCLKLGSVYLVHMPGELFVEYQLAAAKMKPQATVCMAAYGEYGPGYIGTEIAYSQGGYETSYVSRVAPQVEKVLLGGIGELLK